MTASIVSQIFSKLTGADSPFVTVIQLEASLDRITRQLEHLTRTSSPTPGSPTRKQARLCGPDVMAIDGDPPPDSS
jgi:hypothetical protein